jgi:hypothetical protein
MPRQKKINPEPLAEPVVEPVTEVPPPFIEEPIQALKKSPKVKKEKKPKAVKIVETPLMPEEDIDAKILRIVSSHMASIKPQKQDADDIIVVKKRVKKQPPRKKTIYIEEDDSIESVVAQNHPQASQQITYW